MSDDFVLVEEDYDTGRLYECWPGGYPVPRGRWEEYLTLAGELDEMAASLTSGEYVAGWRFRGQPQPERGPLSEYGAALGPMPTPLHNPTPRKDRT